MISRVSKSDIISHTSKFASFHSSVPIFCFFPSIFPFSIPFFLLQLLSPSDQSFCHSRLPKPLLLLFLLLKVHSRCLIFLLPLLSAEETETSVLLPLLPSALLSSSSVVTEHVCSESCKRTKGSHSLPVIEHLKVCSF